MMSAKMDLLCNIHMGYLKNVMISSINMFCRRVPRCKFQLHTIYWNRDFRGVPIPQETAFDKKRIKLREGLRCEHILLTYMFVNTHEQDFLK